jgi:hypothetical protein
MGKNKNKSKKSTTNNVEIQEIVEAPKNLAPKILAPKILAPTKSELIDTAIQEIVDESENIIETETSSKKNKKTFIFSDEFSKLENLKKEELEFMSDKIELSKDHDEKIKDVNSRLKKNRTEQKNIFERLHTLHSKEIKSASKEKRKRNGKNTGGFNKEQIVPKLLSTYLGLEDDTLLSRPKVMHLLSEKFKKENLKDGQQTILDKKNATALNKSEGFKIEFKDNQTFLAGFYNSETNVDI